MNFDRSLRFLEKLSEYVEKGILKVEIFEEIKENVYHQNKEDFGPSKNDEFSHLFKDVAAMYMSEKSEHGFAFLFSFTFFDKFYDFTKDLIQIYLDNNICPVIETESCSIEKLEDIYSLMKT